MSRRLSFVACVMGVVAILSSASMLQATTIYNANDDMYASETGASPSSEFGQWSLGYRADNDTAGGFPYFAVNASATAFNWGWYRNGATDMGIKDIGINPDNATAGVLRWTAPGAGTISTSTMINAGVGPDSFGGIDIHLLLNGVSQYDNTFTMEAGVTISASDLTVATGDVLDLIIGDGSNGNSYDLTGITSHVVTFTPIPEPTTIVLLSYGMFGMLAYAWRKRK